MSGSSGNAVLGIDLGTTSCKAIVFGDDGRELGTGRAGYQLYKEAGGVVEQAPEEWWAALGAACREAIRDVPAHVTLAGVGVCGTMSHVFVDHHGHAQPRAMIWMDARATAEARWLDEHVGADALAGYVGARIPVAATMPPARMRWIARHRPELFAAGQTMLQAKDYMNLRLTGEVATDHTSNVGLVNVRTRTPDHGYLALLGCPEGVLPRAFEPFELIGGVTAEAAEATGIAAGTPVVAGWLDSFANMLGTGLGTPGVAFDVAGTSEVLGVTAGRVREADPGILVLPLYGELDVVYGLTNAGADALRWFSEAFLLGFEAEALPALERVAASAAPGAGGLVFLPYISGERSPVWDESAFGAFVGCRRAQTRADFARAVIESLAHCVRQILTLCAQAAAVPIRIVRASGGGARSDLVNQVKADVLGIPVVAMECAETAALGAAMLALIGVGACDGYSEAVARMTREGATYWPREDLKTLFDERQELYERIYPLLRCLPAAASREEMSPP